MAYFDYWLHNGFSCGIPYLNASNKCSADTLLDLLPIQFIIWVFQAVSVKNCSGENVGVASHMIGHLMRGPGRSSLKTLQYPTYYYSMILA